MTTARILPLDPAAYRSHALHGEDRTWTETNCYVDVWIELLHAWGLDPMAVMPFTLRMDYEGDQCTFFKVPLEDLRKVYGIEVGELNPWLDLPGHIERQVQLGRPVLVEVDSFYLPDTQGSAYKLAHVKTTVGVQLIDRTAHRLGYFHSKAYYEVSGDDYLGLFPPADVRPAAFLPPYIEYVRLDRLERPTPEVLRARAKELLAYHWAARPSVNPLTTYRAQYEHDIAWLATQPLETFHQYAFATLRQVGANFEVAASLCRWFEAQGELGLAEAADAFTTISSTAKTLQFKLARFANTKRPFDAAPLLDTLEHEWARGMACVGRAIGA